MRFKEDATVAPTIEELKSKPSYKDIKTRPLTIKDNNAKNDEEGYM